MTGTVKTVSYNKDWGNYIEVENEAGVVTRYAHLSETFFKVNEPIQKGQIIAATGDTGYYTRTNQTTGIKEDVRVSPHLHYAVEINGVKVDPESIK